MHLILKPKKYFLVIFDISQIIIPFVVLLILIWLFCITCIEIKSDVKKTEYKFLDNKVVCHFS